MHRPVGANRIDGASSDTLIGFLDTQRGMRLFYCCGVYTFLVGIANLDFMFYTRFGSSTMGFFKH